MKKTSIVLFAIFAGICSPGFAMGSELFSVLTIVTPQESGSLTLAVNSERCSMLYAGSEVRFSEDVDDIDSSKLAAEIGVFSAALRKASSRFDSEPTSRSVTIFLSLIGPRGKKSEKFVMTNEDFDLVLMRIGGALAVDRESVGTLRQLFKRLPNAAFTRVQQLISQPLIKGGGGIHVVPETAVKTDEDYGVRLELDFNSLGLDALKETTGADDVTEAID